MATTVWQPSRRLSLLQVLVGKFNPISALLFQMLMRHSFINSILMALTLYLVPRLTIHHRCRFPSNSQPFSWWIRKKGRTSQIRSDYMATWNNCHEKSYRSYNLSWARSIYWPNCHSIWTGKRTISFDTVTAQDWSFTWNGTHFAENSIYIWEENLSWGYRIVDMSFCHDTSGCHLCRVNFVPTTRKPINYSPGIRATSY